MQLTVSLCSTCLLSTSHIVCTGNSGNLSCPYSSNYFSTLSQPSDDVAGDYKLIMVVNDDSNPSGKENTLCNYVNNYDLKHGPMFHSITLTDKNGGIKRGNGQYWIKNSGDCQKPDYTPGLNPIDCGLQTA